MASRQWLKDNPKVLGYVPQPIYQQLQRFTVEREVSLSKALTLILETYFALPPEALPVAKPLRQDAKLNSLEQEVKALRAQVEALQYISKPAEATTSTQKSSPTQREESRRTLTVQNNQIRRPGTEPVSQTTTTAAPQKQSRIVDRPPQKAQAAPATEAAEIPLYQTTAMAKGRHKLGKTVSTQHSSERTLLAKPKLQDEGVGAPTDTSENVAKRLSGKKGFFARLAACRRNLSHPEEAM